MQKLVTPLKNIVKENKGIRVMGPNEMNFYFYIDLIVWAISVPDIKNQNLRYIFLIIPFI